MFLRLLLVASVCMLFVSGEVSATEGKRVALVIGNAAYKYTSELANPRNDAEDIAAALKKLGFDVMSGTDLTRSAMENLLRNFALRLKQADVGLFFYAGHGVQANGKNYLIPVDARLSTEDSLDFEMIRLSVVQRIMERNAKTNLIFLDACRDNPLRRNLARSMGGRSASLGQGLAQVEAGVGTLISFSTQPGNIAFDGLGKNSPYTSALLEHIHSQNDLSTLLINVRNTVMAKTANKQVPWEHSALRAQFYFSSPAPPSSPALFKAQPKVAANMAWQEVKNTEDPEVLRTYINIYQGTVYAALAKSRLALLSQASTENGRTHSSSQNLQAPPPIPPVPSPAPLERLTRQVQSELKRVGCLSGEVDGKWGPKSTGALRGFLNIVHGRMSPRKPSRAALELLRTATGKVCDPLANPTYLIGSWSCRVDGRIVLLERPVFRKPSLRTPKKRSHRLRKPDRRYPTYRNSSFTSSEVEKNPVSTFQCRSRYKTYRYNGEYFWSNGELECARTLFDGAPSNFTTSFKDKSWLVGNKLYRQSYWQSEKYLGWDLVTVATVSGENMSGEKSAEMDGADGSLYKLTTNYSCTLEE